MDVINRFVDTRSKPPCSMVVADAVGKYSRHQDAAGTQQTQSSREGMTKLEPDRQAVERGTVSSMFYKGPFTN